ncbi:MAG: hypothetical protein KF897_12205 [Opitutaceae bacterium]|nr:hypothetical protein [Opitutaceae bacterium]
MKAWTLTAFYLWKDIWSRWLETPGAVLARLLVAVLLGALLLLAQAAFQLGERSLEARILRLGAQSLYLTEAVTGEPGRRPPLGALLAPLGERADLIALRQVPWVAQDEFGGEAVVLVYGPESLPALAPLLAGGRGHSVHLLAPTLPAGLPVSLHIAGADYPALTLAPPGWLARFAADRAVALVPVEMAGDWLQAGYYETTLALARDSDPAALRRLAAALRALLVLEDRPTAQLQTPEALLDELDDLRSLQTRAQTGAALAAGLVVAIVFGSIAVLEYRQNRYIVALLRSFGAPAGLLLLRYAGEALLVAAAAVLLARTGLAWVHAPLFGAAGFEPALLDRTLIDPYAWGTVWPAARWLLLGGALSVVPIAAALRQPVGRILQ